MSNRYTAKVAESLKLRGWIDEIQAKALRADNARLKGEVEAWRKEVEGSASGATLTTIKNLIAERDKAVSTLATYKAAVVEAREALREWLKFTSITPVFPLNDWFNRREELVAKTTPLLSESTLHTLSALTGDATPNPLKSHSL